MGTVTLTSAQAALRLDRIRQVLRLERLTAAQLALEIHISKRWVHPYITRLHDAGEIHVCGWKEYPGGGDFAAIYKGGPGKDVPKPAGRDAVTKSREYRKRVNSDLDARDRYLAKKRTRYWDDKRRAALGISL